VKENSIWYLCTVLLCLCTNTHTHTHTHSLTDSTHTQTTICTDCTVKICIVMKKKKCTSTKLWKSIYHSNVFFFRVKLSWWLNVHKNAWIVVVYWYIHSTHQDFMAPGMVWNWMYLLLLSLMTQEIKTKGFSHNS